MVNDHLVPVRFQLAGKAWHGFATETLWAESRDGERFLIQNTPFYVKNVSLGDVVHARLADSGYEFESVLERGGHSTYRLIPTSAGSTNNARLRNLQKLGCTWEEGDAGLLALDVPPTSDIHLVYATLEAGAEDGLWDFEEGHVGHELNA